MMKSALLLPALLSARVVLRAAAAPHVRAAQLQQRLGVAANVSSGVKPVPAVPGWGDHEKTTFWVTGAGDPELNGCYAYVFSQSNPPSLMYAKQSTHEAFLSFGPAHQCSVEAWEAGASHTDKGDTRYWTMCDPGRIGWFLSKLKCIEHGCTVDVYFRQAAVADGKIPKPLNTDDSEWACRPEIQKRYKNQHYGDCVKPIPKVEMKSCDPLEDKPKFSAATLAAPEAALLFAAAAALMA